MSTVVITGANRGLGLELARRFAKEKWQVIAACRKVEDFPVAEKTENIQLLSLDLSDSPSIENFVKSVHERIDSLDVLINNAGIYDNASDGAPVFDTLDAITTIFQVNAIGPRLISDKLADLLEKGHHRFIVTISSYMGSHSHIDEFDAKHWPYSSSKSATNYAMDTFGYLNSDMKSVLVSPGWMKTRLGGENAPVKPSDAAKRIFYMVKNDKVDSRKLYDIDISPDGLEMNW